MPLIEIPTTTFQGITLEGGWKTHVPDIQADRGSPRYRDIVMLLMRYGMKPGQAEAEAQLIVREFFEKAWKARLMKGVGRWAKKYADQNFGSLEGFEPEMAARLWIPGMVSMGRGGNTDMRTMFLEMRRKDEREE